MKKSNILCGKETNCSKNIVPARMKLKKKKKIHGEFKKLRNNVSFSIRESKNENFKLLFDKNRNNITLIWLGIRQFIILKCKSKVRPNIVKVKSKDITNPT